MARLLFNTKYQVYSEQRWEFLLSKLEEKGYKFIEGSTRVTETEMTKEYGMLDDDGVYHIVTLGKDLILFRIICKERLCRRS